MTDPLLGTKLRIPSAAANLVGRPSLVRRLEEGLAQARLTLVSAPAGYGKTTLLAAWLGARKRPCAWLSLDARDDDLARFFAYLSAALQTVDERVGRETSALLAGPHLPSGDLLTTVLINAVARAGKSFVLVLDDFHVLTNPAIHEAVGRLAEQGPAGLHLVLATRADPPLPLARLRARGQLSEIRAADLAFGRDETAAFLRLALGRALADDEVATLSTLTEGWIAGLQLAALSLKDRQDVPGYLRALAGGRQYIVDYLADEVLDRQPPEVRAFLLRTSILERLTASLCDAVTGEAGSQRTLEQLARLNLFLTPVDPERRWYRYHRLFADLLRRRLRESDPELVRELHGRASAWFEGQGQPAEAIDHALAAVDYTRAADLVQAYAAEALKRSEVATLRRWLEALPGEMLATRPSLGVYRAWALLLAGHPAPEIEAQLRLAEAAGDGVPLAEEALVFRALIAGMLGDARASYELSQRALSRLAEGDDFLRSVVASSMGIACVLRGDVDGAVAAFEQSVEAGTRVGNTLFAVGSLCNVAGLCLVRGQLRRAEAVYRRALAYATEGEGGLLPAAGRALLGLGELARERNDLDTAARLLGEGLDLLKRYGQIGVEVAYLHLARVKQAQGDRAEAQAMIAAARRLAGEPGKRRLDGALLAASEARLWLDQGDLEAAAGWAQSRGFEGGEGEDALPGAGAGGPASYDLQEAEQVLLARLRLHQRRADAALAILAPLRAAAETQGRVRRLIEILNLQALALRALGDRERALAALERALALGAPEGFVRVYLDEGKSMLALLREAVTRGPEFAYAGNLLAEFAGPALAGEAAPAAPAAGRLIEPLSEREREVLALLAAGLSNAEIARRLVVSLSTVKGHTAHIYGKLAVNSRSRAVAAARALGLLPER